MADECKALNAQLVNGLDEHRSHRALAVPLVCVVGPRPDGVAIAGQVGQYQGEIVREEGRDRMPRDVRFGKTVQQHHGGSLAALAEAYPSIVDGDFLNGEVAGEERRGRQEPYKFTR
jgi:hypothetical protein